MCKHMGFSNDQIRKLHMNYTHLSQTERYQIHSMLKLKASIATIAQHLKRSESTIRREIVRNSGLRGYRPAQAQRLCDERSLGSRNARQIDEPTWMAVEGLIAEQLSPEQVCSQVGGVSVESVYQYIYAEPTGWLKAHLRCQKQRRKRYASARSRRGSIPNRRGIELRPLAASLAHVLGHWEGDTIIGRGHQMAIVSLVEKKSKLTRLRLVHNKTAQLVCAAMIEAFEPLQAAVKTITTDNGKEFALHELLDQTLGCDSYFADPYCSWQRGLNENTNGLVRQYIPKNRKLDTVTQEELQMIEDKLNDRPRKCLGFHTPNQVFNALMKRRALRT
jgi:IS30 family transposase